MLEMAPSTLQAQPNATFQVANHPDAFFLRNVVCFIGLNVKTNNISQEECVRVISHLERRIRLCEMLLIPLMIYSFQVIDGLRLSQKNPIFQVAPKIKVQG